MALLIAASSVNMLAFNGSDALSVCMNTLAVVFILDADNAMYVYGLTQTQRDDYEANHKVRLTGEEQRRLEKVKVSWVATSVAFAAVAEGFYLVGLSRFAMGLLLLVSTQVFPAAIESAFGAHGAVSGRSEQAKAFFVLLFRRGVAGWFATMVAGLIMPPALRDQVINPGSGVD